MQFGHTLKIEVVSKCQGFLFQESVQYNIFKIFKFKSMALGCFLIIFVEAIEILIYQQKRFLCVLFC